MPAAGAARFWIFFRSPPLQKSEKSKKGGGSVADFSDLEKKMERLEGTGIQSYSLRKYQVGSNTMILRNSFETVN